MVPLVWLLVASGVAHDTEAEVRELLSLGDKLLLQGRSSYQEAISKYSQAIALQPHNARSRYRRGELYCTIKDFRACEEDLNAVLAADATHRQARSLRAKLRASRGEFAAAAKDLQEVAEAWRRTNDAKARQAHEQAQRLHQSGTQWEALKPLLDKPGLSVMQLRQYNAECVSIIGPLIDQYAKDSVELRLQRAACALWSRNRPVLSDELKHIMAREPTNLQAIILNAEGLRAIGATDLARQDVRRCLSLDPEHGPCKSLHRRIKQWVAIVEAIQRSVDEKKWEGVLDGIDKAYALEAIPPNSDQLLQWRCEAYTELRLIDRGLAACERYLKEENDRVDVRLKMADLHCLNDDLEAAQREVDQAARNNDGHEGVRAMRDKINRLSQAAARKDYYKILGVAKTASSNDIRRAYRGLARKYHPDHYLSQDLSDAERKSIDQRFREINEAKEVLLDSDKRQRFDAGEDVTKPPEQQNFHHGSPFTFQFGGGGGGGFHFEGARHFTHHFQ